MSKGKIALGALIGAAAGIVAGLLTAPKAGKQTRADIKDRATELKNAAADKAEDVRDKASKTTATAKQKLQDYKANHDTVPKPKKDS